MNICNVHSGSESWNKSNKTVCECLKRKEKKTNEAKTLKDYWV